MTNESKTKKIGILGWFWKQANCDQLILKATIDGFERLKPKGFEFEYITNLNKKDFSRLKQLDLLVISGGSILGSLIFPFDRVHKWIDDVKCPIIILGSAFRYEGKEKSPNKKMMIKQLLEKSLISGVRGKLSLKRLKEISPKTLSLSVSGDTIFLLEPNKKKKSKVRTLGIIVRDVPKKELQIGDLKTIHSIFAKFVWTLLNDKEVDKIKFIGTRPNHSGNDDDEMAIIKVEKEFGELEDLNVVIKAITPQTPEDLIKELEKCDFVASMRLHTFATSWIKGIPAQIIDFQFDKGIETAETFGKEEFVIKGDEITLDKMLDNFYKMKLKREKLVREAQTEIIKLKRNLEEIIKIGIEAMIHDNKSNKSTDSRTP